MVYEPPPPSTQAVDLSEIDAANSPEHGVDYILNTFGPRSLVLLDPKGKLPPQGIHVDETTRARAVGLVRSHNNDRVRMGAYFHLNPTKPEFKGKKAAETDTAAIEVVGQADLDAKAGRSMQDCLTTIRALPLPPSFIIMTGGGFQIGYLLDEPLAPTAKNIAWAKAVNEELRKRTGGDSVGDLCRVFRLPFTVNWPNERKRREGRVPVPSGVVVGGNGRRYNGAEIKTAYPITTIVDNNVLAFPPPAVARTSSSLANAQANLSGRWFDTLEPEQQVAAVRHIMSHPAIIAVADSSGRERGELGSWLDILAALSDLWHRSGDGTYYQIALEWSQTSERFISQADFDKDWRSLKPKPGGITIAFLLDVGKKAGVDLSQWCNPVSTTVVSTRISLSDIPARQDPSAALALMNSIFCFVFDWGGEPIIGQRLPDRGWRALTEEQFKRLFGNRRVVFPSGGQGKQEAAPLATWWLSHPDRREAERAGFWPESGLDDARVLNLWGGLARVGVKGCCRRIIRHLLEVICSDDRVCYCYVLKCLAHAVQHPGTAPGVVIVMRSDVEGAGKSILLEIMRRIFGRHAILLNTPEQLTGRFNDHLETVCFIGLNESAYPGDHRQADKLKSMITDAEWVIESKFRGIRRVPNIAHIMMTTNRGWAVPVGNRARRFLVLDVAQHRAGDHAYFDPLWDEINNGGVEAFLDVLMRIPVTDGDLRDVPRTAALRRQQLQSADTMTRWVVDMAMSGQLLPSFGSAQQPGGFSTKQPARMLYASYVNWCETLRQRPVTVFEFGRWLASFGFPQSTIKGTTHYGIPDAQTFTAAAFQKAGIV